MSSDGQSDYAIIAGITRYPYLNDLDGPERDATAFYDWVISPTGGQVLPQNVWLIRTSDFKDPAEPTELRIDDAFTELYLLAQKRGGVLGRRLYIFLAGHGFAQDLSEASLLTANARQKLYSHHIPGRKYADWFRASAYFEEIALFVDCCRNIHKRAPPKTVPFEESFNVEGQKVSWVYAYASQLGQASLEGPSSGFTHGLFSEALLEGLRKARDDQGLITPASLKNFILNYPSLRKYQQQQEPYITFEGQLLFGPRQAQAVPPPETFPVEFELSQPQTAPPISIETGANQPFPASWERTSALRWRTQLPRGIYKASLGTSSALFDVNGSREAPVVRL
jgi:hypothetical protein